VLLAWGAMSPESQQALVRLAATQRGLFSSAQAMDLGVGVRSLHHASEKGLFRRVRRGVYAVAGVPPSPWEEMIAAALAAGPGAVVSHASAAAIHRMPITAPARPELTVASYRRLRLERAVIHRVDALDDVDRIDLRGIGVTSPARTVVDLAPRLGSPLLAHLVDEGILASKFTLGALQECLDRRGFRVDGRPKLQEIIDQHCGKGDSWLELRVYPALAPLQPFIPQYQVVIDGKVYVVDAAWPPFKVAAEVDGRAPRAGSRQTFDADRRKMNAMAADGWRVAHLTSSMCAQEMVSAVAALLPNDWVRGLRGF
jgi:hypothetical protein